MITVRTCVRLGGVLALLATACTESTGPRERTDRILFVSDRDDATGKQDIFRMRPDGSDLENLTRLPADYSDLDATRDGSIVIFAAYRAPDAGSPVVSPDCPARIWRMAPDGSQLRALTSGYRCSFNPRLSPGNTRIAYQRDADIYVANLDGTGETLVTAGLPAVQPSPCGAIPNVTVRLTGWSGEDRVSFWRGICQAGTTYYTVDASGQDLRVVDVSSPQVVWLSPDRVRIVFTLGGQLWVRNVDGSGQRALAATGGFPDDGFSARPNPWSPDGKWVVFTDANGRPAAAGVDDGTIKPLVARTNVEFGGWSPDD
ncbi:MAG TPA: hypothetical protein VFN38_01970, partial [Gemmatimonadaceae bacterium]|nr:hypothetical protein [Gemmatimonadaceae bacterium]